MSQDGINAIKELDICVAPVIVKLQKIILMDLDVVLTGLFINDISTI